VKSRDKARLAWVAVGLLVLVGLVAVDRSAHSAGAERGRVEGTLSRPCPVGRKPATRDARSGPPSGVGRVLAGPKVIGCAGTGPRSIQVVAEVVAFHGNKETCVAADRLSRGDSVGGLCQPASTPWRKLCRRLCVVNDIGTDTAGTGRPLKSVVTGISLVPGMTYQVEISEEGSFVSVPTAFGAPPASFQRVIGSPEVVTFVMAVLPRCVSATSVRIVGRESGGGAMPSQNAALLDPC
jgi:hypothetical protein